MTRSCSKCSKPITKYARTGMCHGCGCADPEVRARKGKLTEEQRQRRSEHAKKLSADPEIVARRAAAGRATHAKPEVKARHRQACAESRARYLADPEAYEKLRAAGRKAGASNFHWANTPEARARAIQTIRRSRLAWCPEEHWPLNAQLKRAGYRLPERQAMIAEAIAAAAERAATAERARIAAMSPFDRQMERVKNGAKLVTKPDTTRAAHEFTLGGVATGMI